MSIFGGVDIRNQLRALSTRIDIVVATPGRLIDHIERRSIDLSQVKYLVLDEADRMFDMGFIDAVRKIVAQLPKERQTLLFSATMSKEIEALVTSVQKNPQRIDIGIRSNPADTVTQKVFPVQQETKFDLLAHILEQEKPESVLIFSRTKHGADKIMKRLGRGGIEAVALHSDRTQAQRQKALDGFKRGRYKVLVATDIAARGIDVDGISHVINYDTPTYMEDYIHRIGRTGRAGASGVAMTFVSYNEEIYLKRIEKFIGKRLVKSHYPGFVPRPKEDSGDNVSQQLHDIHPSRGKRDVHDGRNSRKADQPLNHPDRSPAFERKVTAGGTGNRTFESKRNGEFRAKETWSRERRQHDAGHLNSPPSKKSPSQEKSTPFWQTVVQKREERGGRKLSKDEFLALKNDSSSRRSNGGSERSFFDTQKFRSDEFHSGRDQHNVFSPKRKKVLKKKQTL